MRGTHGLDTYIKECKKFPLLTHEEEKELGRLIQRHLTAIKSVDAEKKARREAAPTMDDASFAELVAAAAATKAAYAEAKDKLVSCNTRLVVYTAKAYADSADIEDLVGAGNLGVMRAAEKYLPDKGTRFGTYAMYWIRNFMRECCAAQAMVHVPSHFSEKTAQGVKPSLVEVAERVRKAKVVPLPDDGFLDPLVYDAEIDEAKHEVETLLKKLPEKYRVVLIRYYLQGCALDELADEMRVTRQRAHQVVQQALAMLRQV